MTIRNIFTVLALGTVAVTTVACNTVDGLGEDLKSASREVKEEI